MTMIPRLCLSLALFATAALPSANLPAAITIDASTSAPAPIALPFEAGGKSPDGHVLAINSRYFTLDGKPWFPVMGEFHYSRYPADEWEAELLKMKASGINVVADYIFWDHHEEIQGQFDWAGQKNLRQFIELCKKHGLYVWIRVGPWDHGEARNGGFPDWLVAGGTVRTNNDYYLGHVKTFFDQIGQQVKGLFWQDGGPIIGMQLENEFHPGGNIGPAHMAQLMQLANAAGMNPPFYTATGWDKAVVPTGFLPVFGGYTEQFWSNSLRELPPNVNFFFTNIRAEDNVGPNLQPKDAAYNTRYAGFPFLTAEMGGGMAIAYHRRPIMLADDASSAALVKLGAGVTMLGFYMYHGGTNPDGQTGLQETQSQPDGHGYNDMEQKSYDFQAPLGEFGQLNPAYRPVKVQNLFLDDFGSMLAPMVTYFPDQMPQTLNDVSTPRLTARVNDEQGFIFINNYERNYALDEHKDFQVSLKLPSGIVQIPSQPTTIPSGVYPIWPVNFPLYSGQLVYTTAQLLCQIKNSGEINYVFFAWPGLKPEFLFNLDGKVEAKGGRVTAETPQTFRVDQIEPGTGTVITVELASSESFPLIRIIVLSREQALNTWKATIAGQDRLFLSPAGLYFKDNQAHLIARARSDLRVGAFPALTAKNPSFKDMGADGIFQQFADLTREDIVDETVDFKITKEAGPSVAAKMSRRNVAMEPEDADFDRAAVWSVHVPASALQGQAVLKVDYQGDVARLYAGNHLVEDNFYKGAPFEFGLWRLTAAEKQTGLDLKILPLRQDTRLYLPQGMMPEFSASGEALKLKGISIEREYEAVLQVAP